MKNFSFEGWMLGLVLTSAALCPAAAQAHETRVSGDPFFYLGLNTGASFVTVQSLDRFSDPNVGFELTSREEHSQRGFNGGAFFGFNFYCCPPYLLAVELSGNYYSNNGHYTIDFIDPGNGFGGPISPSFANYEVEYNMQYDFHLTLRPGFQINDTTLLYFQGGVGLGNYETKVHKLNDLNEESPAYLSAKNSEWLWGGVLGAGIQKQLSCHLSVFAAYEYTYYGKEDLKNLTETYLYVNGETQSFEKTLKGREHTVDVNTFKMGVVFNF